MVNKAGSIERASVTHLAHGRQLFPSRLISRKRAHMFSAKINLQNAKSYLEVRSAFENRSGQLREHVSRAMVNGQKEFKMR